MDIIETENINFLDTIPTSTSDDTIDTDIGIEVAKLNVQGTIYLVDREYRIFLYDPKILIQVGIYEPQTGHVLLYREPEWDTLLQSTNLEKLAEYLEKNGLNDRDTPVGDSINSEDASS
jgi:hypothetical protein